MNDEVTLSKADDVLDIGMLAYLLLNDVRGDEESDYKTVLSCKGKDEIFDGGQWHKVSREAKELISLMVDPDPR